MKCLTLLILIIAIELYSAQGPTTKLYVGNMSWYTNDNSLKQAFEQFGKVLDATVVHDRDTGRSRGFGFVTMATEEGAQAAIVGLNEQELDGRRIKVNYANSRRRP